MSYQYRRVIPRDLFNEANLLKCYGQLWLCLEKLNLNPSDVALQQDDDGGPFEVEQSDDDGSTRIQNIYLYVRGAVIPLHRPMNSRQPFPLYCTSDDGAEWPVFTDDGALSAEMVAFLTAEDS